MTVATATQARAAATAAAAPGNRDRNNHLYLSTCEPKQAVMTPAAGGGVVTQAWSAGSTLIWDVPTIDGGYLESIVVKCNFTVNPAPGTAAAYALTKVGPLGLFKEFWLELGGMQARSRPFIIRILDMLSGFERTYYERVNAGNTVAAQTAAIWSADPMPIVVNTNNSWVFEFRIPLRLLPGSPAGMIPMTAGGTVGQFKLICCASPLASTTVSVADPLDNVVAWTGGTSPGLTVTGTVEAVAEFRDGKSLSRVPPLPLDLSGVPTVQWFIDRQLNPLTAATLMNAPIYTKQKHIYALSLIVDGNQYTDFALTSNIQALALAEDSSMQNRFYSYGSYGNNLTVQDFYEKLTRSRYGIGQDLDPGVVPWVAGPWQLGIDPDAQAGNRYLNMTQTGWPDVNYGVQVATVGTVCTPRVETFLVSVLDQGLVPAA